MVHTWTSLISTVFMLLLCLTGLPLIFHHEIDHMLGQEAEAPDLPAGTPHLSLDRIITNGLAPNSTEQVRYVVFDDDDANLVHLLIAATKDAPDEDNRFATLDARTGEVLRAPDRSLTFTGLMLRLHTDLFAGLPGMLFLGLMGLLMVVAIVSGVVLYAPFMRRLEFGTVRKGRSPRLRWLDLHNLLGIVTVCWLTVVGFTGVINTWSQLVLMVWQQDQLAEMVAPYRDMPPLTRLGPVQPALDTAKQAVPDMHASFIAFPGTPFTSAHHYAVFMKGDTTLTSRLIRPALIDAESGKLTDSRVLPWYVTALLVSQPLHFGDYGGMPLKIIWAVLDVAAIVVLGSGLYLWIARRRGAHGRKA
ncbi:PepSY-associated TM helix domain-containing protein [Azorhizobium oxalatiphilum]|uniref:PepSY-associated TM helix domain-containing protein n=1 Tax=Azorhizobium oxalatiphilum TaxID=980631 RepID=UPI001FCE5EDA|nr:PepSY domain-containing protein [Azorhizobium oxalatiphilum]